MPKASLEPILDRLDRLARGAEPWWQPYHDAMFEEDSFLGGDRYEDDFGLYNRDRRQVQIRGQETQDAIRHKVARATERPRSISARPIDDDDDAQAAELAAALVEWELSNPFKRYDVRFEEALQAACEHRIGAVMCDWDPECGPYGEILFRYVDGRNLIWEPGYDPHDILCGWLRERKRLDVDYARDKYDAPWLEPDRVFSGGDRSQQYRQGVPLMSGGHTMYGGPYDDDKVTIDSWWFKNDRTLSKATKEVGYDELPKGERYMSCSNTCGYRSETQTMLQKRGALTGELPESFDYCPGCEQKATPGTVSPSGSLVRIDARAEDAQVLAYQKGRRLVVHAPFAPGPKREPLSDDKWPIPKARSFPILILTAYVSPGKPMGPCDTTLMWDQQVAADNLRTMGIDRVFQHQTYYGIPGAGITAPDGRRFEFRDDQFNVFIKDQSKQEFGPLTIDHVDGTGLDPSWQLIWGVINGSLTQFRGMYDQGPMEDRTNKSGVALKTENAIGEIPVEHFKRRCSREVSIFAGIVYDYISATYTPARVSRLNLEGSDLLLSMWGDDLPGMDFVIGDNMPWSGLEKDRQEGFDQAMQVAQQYGPDGLEAWAEFHEIPRSVVRKIQRVFEALKAQQPQPDAEQPPGAEPDAAATLPPASDIAPVDAGAALPMMAGGM